MTTPALFEYLLRLGDTSLVLGQRLGEWIGHAPALEEDLGLANLSLDFVGQARLLLTYAGEVEGRGRDEDTLAFFREGEDYRNLTLVEQPNGDFAQTIVRQSLADAWQMETYEALSTSNDATLAAIAAKSLKETRYHWNYSAGWLVRLGDGTDESRARTQRALDALWPYTVEMFQSDGIDEQIAAAGIGPRPESLASAWSSRIDDVLRAATLRRPASAPYSWHGKRGQHSEHLGLLLAEMQSLQRAHPGVSW